MEPVKVIGLAPGTLEITRVARVALAEADLVVGGRRLLDACPVESFKAGAEQLPISGPLPPIMDAIRDRAVLGGKVVVLADGDPLFFGIGKRLGEELGVENLLVEPNVSTMQVASARLGLPWQEMDFVSLHGREDYSPLYAALVRADLIAVFTDATNTPAEVARALLERGADCFSMTVLEDLGTEREKVRLIPLPDTWGMDFAPLNLVILERLYPPEIELTLGIHDHFYLHQKNLITKLPVRAAGLAFLNVQPDSTVWDLGAGSGAVSIEASHLARRGRVFAVERHKTRAAMIRENIRRTGAWLVDTILGETPDCLEELPDPDRIFIGGGLGGEANQESALLKVACDRLKPRGRIVVHTILLDSLHLAKDYFKKLGWHFGVTQLQASATDSLAGDLRFKAQNPVFILWAEKP
ncbi:precorrin-6y C5,15-methyltransferase (decarboxylating) subunit CbiE [Pseudodesulfovibrio sp. zrk46]|uniref:precorrin-6y C5,15-methyltransferase (decarboxylating) subunit CbiE n=1 Tax=Pseudodesulfovibrio sp. zrk46 TaxID=2725288 RepID=UPI0014499791|nr:precorrin-6y C5,15-methyltransferase (decarboxylating) subunit CbiE [Pseudodesulfovibrio sp. zrk46]QJB56462.1 precorrin-6y C5,15-methyltransferase (decarboxylating) subunit CbiE [Pseudodesulfovibrio sp. zrk46]